LDSAHPSAPMSHPFLKSPDAADGGRRAVRGHLLAAAAALAAASAFDAASALDAAVLAAALTAAILNCHRP